MTCFEQLLLVTDGHEIARKRSASRFVKKHSSIINPNNYKYKLHSSLFHTCLNTTTNYLQACLGVIFKVDFERHEYSYGYSNLGGSLTRQT